MDTIPAVGTRVRNQHPDEDEGTVISHVHGIPGLVVVRWDRNGEWEEWFTDIDPVEEGSTAP